MMDVSFATLKPSYVDLWNASDVLPARQAEADGIVDQILRARVRYEDVGRRAGVPWFMVAALHSMECSLRFDQHLHNGDALEHKTHQVPAGRPPGPGPWTWEESAVDALHCDKLDAWQDWSVPGCLWNAERYNGWGSRAHGVNCPYLWGGSTAQQPGKYIHDGPSGWDPHAVTHQIGVATLLIAMDERDLITFPDRGTS